MNLLRVTQDRYEFQLGRREQHVFCEVLRAYPLTPLEHHRIVRGDAPGPAGEPQGLLNDSMSALKAASRRRLDTFLANHRRFIPLADGSRLVFTREELEWLLQVLNDVRVGSWLALGSPDPDAGDPPRLTPETARYLPLMQLAAAFQYAFLAALDGTDGVGWAPPPES
jgi:hypothetical protein